MMLWIGYILHWIILMPALTGSAWAVGFRSFQKALLSALCTPYAELRRLQEENRMTELMVMQENLKMYPLGEVWEEYCRLLPGSCGQPDV